MDELFERIIFDAIKKGATDIHLQSKEKGMIQMRIYGQLEMYECIEQDKMKKMINYIRFLSKIDLNYHLKPQTGHLIYNLQKILMDFEGIAAFTYFFFFFHLVTILLSYRFFTNRVRIAFNTAITITPTSANIATHIFAMPSAPSSRQISFTPIAK